MEFITEKCHNCGAPISFDSNSEAVVCSFCNSTIFVKQTQPESVPVMPVPAASPKKKSGLSRFLKVMLIILAIIGALFIAAIIYSVYFYDPLSQIQSTPSTFVSTRTSDSDETYLYDPGDTFIFDEFEITIGDSVEWIVLEHHDEESPLHGADAVRIPITFTNLSDETRRFSLFALTIYGAEGVGLPNISSILWRDEWMYAGSAGDMRSGATISDRYLYFLYDGDGYYYISFSIWSEATREVKIYVSR